MSPAHEVYQFPIKKNNLANIDESTKRENRHWKYCIVIRDSPSLNNVFQSDQIYLCY